MRVPGGSDTAFVGRNRRDYTRVRPIRQMRALVMPMLIQALSADGD
jgi:hypothetical protein